VGVKHRLWGLMALMALPGCGTSPGPVTARPLPVEASKPVVAPAPAQPVEQARPLVVPASPLGAEPARTAPAVPALPPVPESVPDRSVSPTAMTDEALADPTSLAPLGPLPDSQLTDLPTGDIRLDEALAGSRTVQRVVRTGRTTFVGGRRFGRFGRHTWRPGWRNWWNYGRYRYAYIGGYYYPYYWTGAAWYPYTFYDAGIPYQPYFTYYGGSLMPGATIVTQPVVQQPIQPIVQNPVYPAPGGQVPYQGQMPAFQGQVPSLNQGQMPTANQGQFPGYPGQLSNPPATYTTSQPGATRGFPFAGWNSGSSSMP